LSNDDDGDEHKSVDLKLKADKFLLKNQYFLKCHSIQTLAKEILYKWTGISK